MREASDDVDGQHDDELVARFVAGDAEAFVGFYRRRLAAVLGLFLRRTRDPELTADLTAEPGADRAPAGRDLALSPGPVLRTIPLPTPALEREACRQQAVACAMFQAGGLYQISSSSSSGTATGRSEPPVRTTRSPPAPG